MKRYVTEELLMQYQQHLHEEEKSAATISKYMRDLNKLFRFLAGRELSKELMIAYKEYLQLGERYKTASINSFLVAANCFLEYLGWYDLKVKTMKVQKEVFIPENKDLSREEYKRLVRTAEKLGKKRMALLLQTICSTGIRVSELSSITVANVKRGIACICCKGKERCILLPRALQVKLLRYIRKENIRYGFVFRTSGGKLVDRSNIWKEMKALCSEAGVSQEKVYPHNLRHLFAKVFYGMNKDIAKLADVLGHSSVETTRIYIRTTSSEHQKQLEDMELVLKTG